TRAVIESQPTDINAPLPPGETPRVIPLDGRLTGPASLSLEIEVEGAPHHVVVVVQPDPGNASVLDLVEDLNAALRAIPFLDGFLSDALVAEISPKGLRLAT